MKLLRLTAVLFLSAGWTAFLMAQTVETKDGVRVVHNRKGGLWGKEPKIKLVPVHQLGDVDAEDEAYAFNRPADIALDSAGNIFVLDSSNGRIQKFDKDYKFVASFGRRGQGPGEFNMPAGMEMDAQGRLYISDSLQERITVLTPEGGYLKSIEPDLGRIGAFKLLASGAIVAGRGAVSFQAGKEGPQSSLGTEKILRLLDADGRLVREMGEPTGPRNEMLRITLNRCKIDVDNSGRIYMAFLNQNRIEMFDSDGRLRWRADRKLNYDLEIQDKGRLDQSGGQINVSMPKLSACTAALAVDAKGRSWVVTLDRQLKEEEKVSSRTITTDNVSRSEVKGNRDLRTTDAYKIEIFDAEGVLLGEIPLTMFVDDIYIFGDRLFILDKLRGVCFQEFKIIESA
jgi:hypothetical protein